LQPQLFPKPSIASRIKARRFNALLKNRIQSRRFRVLSKDRIESRRFGVLKRNRIESGRFGVLRNPGADTPRSPVNKLSSRVQDIAGIMRRVLLWLLILSSVQLASCNALQKKHDNPVMTAAPRRVEAEPAEADEAESKYVDTIDVPKKSKEKANSDVVPVSATEKPKEDDGSDTEKVRKALASNPWDDWKDDTTIFNSQVAATVNGAPILNGDVLDRYAGFLISVRGEMQKAAADPRFKGEKPGPEQYEKFRYGVIQREIASHIQKKLLVERLKGGMKAEQLKMMEAHIDEQFVKEVDKLKKELKVSNKTELELALNKKGTTLQNVRDNFALDRLAGECIAIKSEKLKPIERPEMIAYYQSHPDDFLVTAKVKWEQIQVSITPSLNRKAARAKLEQAIAELEQGVPFDTVARKYSDGSTAREGGAWDWMEEGNLADTKLEKKLFSMSVNTLSEIHEYQDSLSVVRVTERQNPGRKPFREVQKEIHDIIDSEHMKNRPKKLFKELFSQAVIETHYSLPEFVNPND